MRRPMSPMVLVVPKTFLRRASVVRKAISFPVRICSSNNNISKCTNYTTIINYMYIYSAAAGPLKSSLLSCIYQRKTHFLNIAISATKELGNTLRKWIWIFDPQQNISMSKTKRLHAGFCVPSEQKRANCFQGGQTKSLKDILEFLFLASPDGWDDWVMPPGCFGNQFHVCEAGVLEDLFKVFFFRAPF